jgi:two-component system, LytTR family, response regulator LytT
MTNDKHRVIVIEDEQDHLEFLCARLREFDEIDIIETANNVEEAFFKIVEHKPDLIFLDNNLSGEKGDVKILDRLHKNGHLVPYTIVVAALGISNDIALNAPYKHRILNFIEKPIAFQWETRLRIAIDRYIAVASNELTPDDGNRTFKIAGKYMKLHVDDIFAIVVGAVGSGQVTIETEAGLPLKYDQTMAQTLREIASDKFMQVSRDSAINTDFILSVDFPKREIVINRKSRPLLINVGDVYVQRLRARMRIAEVEE